MSANVFSKYVRFICDNCGASETFDTPLVDALASAFKTGWRAAGTTPGDKTRHYCAGCYAPTLYDELVGRTEALDERLDERDEALREAEEMILTRDAKIVELERERDEDRA